MYFLAAVKCATAELHPVCKSRKLFDHLKLSRSISCCFFTFFSRIYEEFLNQIQYFEDLELIFIKGLAVAVLLINEILCKMKRCKVTPFKANGLQSVRLQ